MPYDDLKYAPGGAVLCTDLGCKKCSFSGGYSGYCSVCWEGLSQEEKKKATEEQEPLQLERQRVHDKKIEEDKAKKNALKRKREADIKEFREKQRQKKENAITKGHCYCMSTNESHKWSDPKSTWNKTPLTDDNAVEEWSCGLINRNLPLTTNEGGAHIHSDPNSLARLQQVSEELTTVLDGVEEGSSEGGEPYVGFFVCVKDNAHLNPKDNALKIIKKIIPTLGNMPDDEDGTNRATYQYIPVKTSNYQSLFPRGDEIYDANIAAVKKATDLIFSVGVKGTGFQIYPNYQDFFVGPIFAGARTENGDIIGVRSHIVWT